MIRKKLIITIILLTMLVAAFTESTLSSSIHIKNRPEMKKYIIPLL